MTFLSNAEVWVWYCHDLPASHHHNIQALSWILSGLLVLGNHLCLVHEETWPWKNLKEGCHPLHHCLPWQWCHLCHYGVGVLAATWWGSWFCPLDLCHCLCWPQIWPGNGREWLLKEFSTIWGSMEVSSMLSMEVCTFSMEVICIFSMEVIWMVLKGGWLHAVCTFGHQVASRPGPMWLTFALASSGCAAGFSVPPPDCLDLHWVLKWFFWPHLWHFLPHTGHSLGGWDVLH